MTTWQPLKSYFQDWKEGKSWKPDNPLKSSKMETRERIKTWQPPRPLSAPLQTFLLQLLPPPDQCIWWQMQDSKNPQIIGKHWTPRICHFFLLLRRNTSSLQQKATKKSPHVPHLLVRLLWWLSRPRCQRRWWRWRRRQGWEGRRWGWWGGEWAGELTGSCSSPPRPPPAVLEQAPPVAWTGLVFEFLDRRDLFLHLFLDVRLLASGILHIGHTLRAGFPLHSSQMMWPSRH